MTPYIIEVVTVTADVRSEGILLSAAEFSFESGLTHTFHTCRYLEIHCRVYISQKYFQIVFFYQRKVLFNSIAYLSISSSQGGCISVIVQYKWYTRVHDYYMWFQN